MRFDKDGLLRLQFDSPSRHCPNQFWQGGQVAGVGNPLTIQVDASLAAAVNRISSKTEKLHPDISRYLDISGKFQFYQILGVGA